MAEDTPAAPLSLPARPLVRAPASLLPPGTCDCHFHVIPPGRPFSPSRGYTPPIQPIAGWRRMADAVGIARGVLVQPSIYGMDNRALLDALAAHPGTLRGVVVIPTDTTPAEIARLHRLGVRGVRINPLHATGLGLAAVPAIARLIRPFGWHLQAARRAVKTAQKQFDRDALPPRRAWLKLVLDAYVIREMAIPMLLRPENPRHNRNQPSRSHLGSSRVPRRRIECLPTGTHGRRLNPISEAS